MVMKRFSNTAVYANDKDDCSVSLASGVRYGSSTSLSSMMSGNSVGTTMSTSSLKSSNKANRSSSSRPSMNVSFGDDQIYDVDCYKNLPQEHKDELWYEGRAMGMMRKSQIRELKLAQREANNSGVSLKSINPDLTWRGFEDIEGGWCRVEKSSTYTSDVVKHYHSQLNSGYTDVEELKKIAKGLSKPERQRVRDLGMSDAKKVGMSANAKKKKNSNRNNPPRRSSSGVSCGSADSGDSKRSSLRRKMSVGGLMSMMKKSASGVGMNSGSSVSSAPSSKIKNASWSARANKSNRNNNNRSKVPPVSVS